MSQSSDNSPSRLHLTSAVLILSSSNPIDRKLEANLTYSSACKPEIKYRNQLCKINSRPFNSSRSTAILHVSNLLITPDNILQLLLPEKPLLTLKDNFKLNKNIILDLLNLRRIQRITKIILIHTIMQTHCISTSKS